MPERRRAARNPTAAVLTGLTVAWGGTALLVSPLPRGLADPSRLANCRSRKLYLNAFSGKIVGVQIKHPRRSRGKLKVRERGSEEGYDFFLPDSRGRNVALARAPSSES